MTNIIDHLETFLGPIVSGYGHDDEGKKLPLQIARFENSPPNTITLVTLGFSKIQLAMGASGRRVRQEYFVTVDRRWDAPNLPALLHQVAMEAYQKDSAYLRGQVLGPRGSVVAGTALEALIRRDSRIFSRRNPRLLTRGRGANRPRLARTHHRNRSTIREGPRV